MLTPLAIATQGLGYSQRLVAVQGLWESGVVVPPEVLAPFISMPRRVRVPSFVQLVEEDELMLMCAAGLLIATH